MKYCSKCDTTKSKVLFGINRSMADGLQSNCKECRKIVNNEHYKRSPARREAIKRNRIKAEKTQRHVST